LQQQFSGLQPFDPSGLQSQISSLQQTPGFDPSGLQSQITALQQAPGFDPTGLQQQIAANQSAIGQVPQFDPSGLAGQIAALQNQLVGLQTSYNPQVTGGFNPAGGPINVGAVGGPIKIKG
jgi:hypothetical protein